MEALLVWDIAGEMADVIERVEGFVEADSERGRWFGVSGGVGSMLSSWYCWGFGELKFEYVDEGGEGWARNGAAVGGRYVIPIALWRPDTSILAGI